MKRDRLETFVETNRHEFDIHEPSDRLWDSISEKLDKEPAKSKKRFSWMKVAAVFAFMIVGSSVIYQQKFGRQTALVNSGTLDPEVQELIEAEAYYAQEVSGKLVEIQKCYAIYPELKIEIESDLNELEMMYHDLKNDLKENISNKEVIEAMIENNRYRMKLVDDVLEQINC